MEAAWRQLAADVAASDPLSLCDAASAAAALSDGATFVLGCEPTSPDKPLCRNYDLLVGFVSRSGGALELTADGQTLSRCTLRPGEFEYAVQSADGTEACVLPTIACHFSQVRPMFGGRDLLAVVAQCEDQLRRQLAYTGGHHAFGGDKELICLGAAVVADKGRRRVPPLAVALPDMLQFSTVRCRGTAESQQHPHGRPDAATSRQEHQPVHRRGWLSQNRGP